MLNRNIVALLSGVVILGTGVSSRAEGCNAATASDYFDEGLRSSEQGQFEAAISSFDAAYRCQPSPDALYNISQAQIQLGRYQAAIDNLQRYLESAGQGELTVERRLAVQRQIELLRKEIDAPQSELSSGGPQLITLEVHCDVPGALLFVDGSRLASFPFEQVLELQSGKHVLRFKKDGFESEPVHVDWVAGRSEALECEFAEQARVSSSVEPAVGSAQGASEPSAAGAPIAEQHAADFALPFESVLLGSLSLLAAGGATVLYIGNEERYDTWERTDAELSAARRQQLTASEAERFNATQLDNNERLDSIRATNIGTIGLSVGAAAALLGACYYALVDSPGSRPNVALTQREVLFRAAF